MVVLGVVLVVSFVGVLVAVSGTVLVMVVMVLSVVELEVGR